MAKKIHKIYHIAAFIIVFIIWLFSLYRISSHFGLTDMVFKLFKPAAAFNIEFPPDPPNPPSPPCPSCCQPTPTPTVSIQPTPSPTPEVSLTPTPTPTLSPTPSVSSTPTLIPTATPSESNNNGGGGGSAQPPYCGSATPPKPFLRTLIEIGTGQVKLIWDPVDPASGYAISYGPQSGNYLYGVSDTGKTSSFVINDLGTGNYCFALRAINGCAPGELSNEKCINEIFGAGTGGAVLGAKTPTVLGATGNDLSDYLITFYQNADFGAKTFTQNLPEKIDIDKVDIHLGVSMGQVNNNFWDISESGASYLAGSGQPGKIGNMIIYGHNKNQLLGPIRWLERGAEISISNDQGKIFKYQVIDTKTISPDQTDILLPTSDSTLTLYTCTGAGDKLRFVVIAKLTS